MGGDSKSKKKPTQLDLANAYGSVPQQLLWKTLEAHRVPRVVIEVLQEYFNGFSPTLFVLAMQIVLNAIRAGIPESRMGRGVYMPSIKAFMDDTTIVLNRKQIVQRVLDKLNDLLLWCRMAIKPAKSRSLSLTREKVCRYMYFTVGGQRIPIVPEEPVKSLERAFDEFLRDKIKRLPQLAKCWLDGPNAIARTTLQGRFKVWLLQFVLLPMLLWPFIIYEIGLPSVEEMEREINQCTRKLVGVATNIYRRSLSIVGVQDWGCRSGPMMKNTRSAKSKHNGRSTTPKTTESAKMPQLRSGRKFGAQEEIEKSEAILAFEEIRGPIQVDCQRVGWNHFERWSSENAPAKAAIIIQERRRQMETLWIRKKISGSATKPTRPIDDMGWSPPKVRHMERHLANVSPQFGIHDQIGLWCTPFSDQFAEVGDSPRLQLQTLLMFPFTPARALAMNIRPCPWALHMATLSGHLQIVLEAAKIACYQANARETAPARRTYLLRECSSQHHKEKNENQRRTCFRKPKIRKSQQTCKDKALPKGATRERQAARLSVGISIDGLLHPGWIGHDKIGWILAMFWSATGTWISQWISMQEGMVPICSKSVREYW